MKKYRLQILGIVSDSVLNLVSKGLIREYKKGLTLVFFCSYSEDEVPIGEEFRYLINPRTNQTFTVNAIHIDVTQSWGISLDSIPIGHKTISRFEFSESDLFIIRKEIPIINSWFTSNLDFELIQN
jgi:hypothetical protein